MMRTTGLPREITEMDFHFFRWIIYNEVCSRLHEIPVQTGVFYELAKVNVTVLDFIQSPPGLRVMPLEAYREFLNSDGKVEEDDLEALDMAILGDSTVIVHAVFPGSGGDRVEVYRRCRTL
ncbi:hypothetical protein K435DRAFT_445091 [Dendrothele bispora CBS 962.96]|uniref:Uncharacterized protein n=1 Tax=Dendrothele bispora (strain CBS 962.96) TaxID=1314807 RepID=A0A4S8L2E2_DENBC|nr:hypothetical protein K435DRAFT_445091 [Dendrothele bispora CBS 962.96]